MDRRHEIVGASRAIRQVIADALKVAGAKTSTLIVGESGTGKEILPFGSRSVLTINLRWF